MNYNNFLSFIALTSIFFFNQKTNASQFQRASSDNQINASTSAKKSSFEKVISAKTSLYSQPNSPTITTTYQSPQTRPVKAISSAAHVPSFDLTADDEMQQIIQTSTLNTPMHARLTTISSDVSSSLSLLSPASALSSVLFSPSITSPLATNRSQTVSTLFQEQSRPTSIQEYKMDSESIMPMNSTEELSHKIINSSQSDSKKYIEYMVHIQKSPNMSTSVWESKRLQAMIQLKAIEHTFTGNLFMSTLLRINPTQNTYPSLINAISNLEQNHNAAQALHGFNSDGKAPDFSRFSKNFSSLNHLDDTLSLGIKIHDKGCAKSWETISNNAHKGSVNKVMLSALEAQEKNHLFCTVTIEDYPLIAQEEDRD